MLDVGSVIGIGGVVVAAIVSVASLFIQEGQRRIMRQQVEGAFDPDRQGGSQFERHLRDYITRRIDRVRSTLRQEFGQQITGLGFRIQQIEGEAQRQTQRVDEILSDKRVVMLVQQIQEVQNAREQAVVQIAQMAREVYDSTNEILHATDHANEEIRLNVPRIIAQVGRYDNDIAQHEHALETLRADIMALQNDSAPEQNAARTLHLLGEYLRQI